MAVDKLVDSTQLDADLTSVANAIRAKSGGSGSLAFPAGFVSEIGNIPSGGGYSISAVFTQGNNRIFTTDDLDVLRQYLVVTAHYSDNTSEAITDYSLSGTLTAGTSTITATALDLVTTFTVTVTAATDVTPTLSGFSTSASTQAQVDANGNVLVYNTSNGTYKSAYKSFTFEDGMRYRVTGHVDWFSGVAIAGFYSSSNAGLGIRTSPMASSQDFSFDGIPSESEDYTNPGRFSLFCTYETSTIGRVVYSNIKIIKYSDADANELLSILSGGESA